MKVALATTLAAAMLAASSMAYAASNNNDGTTDGAPRDEQSTGSINTEGRTPTPEQREYCQTAPANDATCQSLGLSPNP